MTVEDSSILGNEMNFKNLSGISHGTWIKIWVIFVVTSLSIYSFTSLESYLKIDAIFVWALSCIALLYQFRENSFHELSGYSQKAVILAGILLCILSFINIPIGFGNPPYSIGEFTLFIAGIGIILFGVLGNRTPLLPIAFPAIAVIGFQAYELIIRHQEWITAPLIPFILSISSSLFRLYGIPVVTYANIISFTAVTGDPIHLSIVSDCTGIWSLGTFTVAALIVLSSFEKGRTKNGLILIAIGYIGTFIANLGRIFIIGLSGYYFGPAGVIETVHIHAGWIMFSFWMIIFWYYFFTRQLEISFRLPSLR